MSPIDAGIYEPHVCRQPEEGEGETQKASKIGEAIG